MAYYHRSISVQAGTHAICITEPSFENRKYNYTFAFYVNERLSSAGVCQSLSFTTSYRGLELAPVVADSFFSYKGSLKFPVIEDIPDSEDSIEIVAYYENLQSTKYMAIYKVTMNGDLFYGGSIKEKSLFREFDKREVMLNLEMSNSFLIPKSIGEAFEGID